MRAEGEGEADVLLLESIVSKGRLCRGSRNGGGRDRGRRVGGGSDSGRDGGGDGSCGRNSLREEGLISLLRLVPLFLGLLQLFISSQSTFDELAIHCLNEKAEARR